MNRLQHSWLCLSAVLLLAINLSACDRPSPSLATPRPSPEEDFKYIVATVRRVIETGSGGLSGGIPHGDGGFTGLSINNKVLDEFIAPAAEGESPRGRITIDSETEVTIQPGLRSSDRRDEARGFGESGTSVDDKPVAGSLLQPSRRGEAPSLGEAPPPRKNKVSATYELVHRNGRWELASEIDRKKEPAAFDVFEYALKMQL